MLQGHSFSNHKSLFNRSFIKKPSMKDKIDFQYALKSIDVPDENFMNFFTSNQTKTYLYLQEIYDSSLKNQLNIDKYFTNKEYSITNQRKNNRLKKFIYETSNTLMSDIDLLGIIKYKHREKKEFQIFLKYDIVQDKAFVYLIDIYHLVLPTEFDKMCQKRANAEQYYKKMKRNLKKSMCGLETIADQNVVEDNSIKVLN